MLEQVEMKIQELSKQQKEEYYKRKDADLYRWGLVSKDNGKGRKATPLIVTDEEYEALIDASSTAGSSGRNTVANVMNVTSIAVVVLGFILGVVLGKFYDELGFVCVSASLLGSVLLGLLFRGIGEAIRLLQQILDMKTTEKVKRARRRAAKQFPETQPVTSQSFYSQQPQQVTYQQGYSYPKK